MKKLLFVLSIAMLATSCSSGTTVADLPSNATSRFNGTFQNTPGTQSGTVTLDIIDNEGVVTGNIIFQSSGDNCLRNGTIANGMSTGFNLSFSVPQSGREFTTTVTVREPDPVDEMGMSTGEGDVISISESLSSSGAVGTLVTTLGNGNVQERVTTAAEVTGNLNVQLTIGNGGSNLSGTYTTDGSVCPNPVGSGSMNLNR